MANNSDVLVHIGGDASELSGTLAGLGSDLLGWIGGINPAVGVAVGAISGLGIAAFESAEKIHEALNQIVVGTGATGAQLDSLKESFENVFRQVPQDAEVVGKSIADVNTALGLTGEGLEAATKGFLDLSDSIGEDVGPLIQNVTQAMNSWGVAAEDATLVQDKLLKVSQDTGIGVTALAGELTKSETTFKQWGLSMDESAVLLGNFHKNGVTAGDAAGALQKAIKTLTEAGIQPSKEALQGMIDGIANAGSETESTQQAVDLFGKSGVAMAQIIRDGKLDIDNLTASLAGAEGQVGRTDDATATLGENFEVLTHSLTLLLEPLGVVLVDGLNAVVEGFMSLFDPLTYTSDGFKALFEWMQPLTDAFNNYIVPALTTVGALFLGLAVTYVQGALIPALSFLWQSVLVPLGGFLRDVLVGAIEVVFGALNSFLGVLKEIPGVSTLFENAQKAINTVLGDGKTKADEATTSAKGLQTAHSDLAGTITGKAHPAVTNISGALKDKKEATDLAKSATTLLEGAEKDLATLLDKLQTPAVKSVKEAQEDLEKARKDGLTAANNLKTAEQNLKTAKDNSKTSTADLKTATTNLEAARKAAVTATNNLKTAEDNLKASQAANKAFHDGLNKSYEDMVKNIGAVVVAVPELDGGLSQLAASSNVLKGALEGAQGQAFAVQNALVSMGVTPKEDLRLLAEDAQAKFALIQSSGVASATEVDKAHLAAARAMVAYYQQAGIDVPAELQTTLTNLEAKYDTHKDNVQTVFTSMQGAIRQSITQLSTDLVNSLWEGDGSFGEKAKSALVNLGKAVTTSFVTPATDAIAGFISGALADLIGGKGFGGLQDRITTLGDSFSNLFGGAGAPSVPGAPGGSPSVPGGSPGAGGAASAGSGLAGTFTAIFSGISALTDVLSMFGVGVQGTIKDRLSEIKNDTAFLAWAFDGGGLHEALLTMKNDISNFVNGAFGGWYLEHLKDQSALQYEINDNAKEMVASLATIRDNVSTIPGKLDALKTNPPVVHNHITVTLDGAELTAGIVEYLDLQYRQGAA